MLGAVLLVGMPIMIVTGLLSYAAYDPQLGGSNDQTPGRRRCSASTSAGTGSRTPSLALPAQPGHARRCSGIVLIPIVLAKLWSVGAEAVRLAAGDERVRRRCGGCRILLLVGSVLFLLVTGVMNIQYDYAFGFSFYTGHLYAAWVFIARLHRARRAAAADDGALAAQRARCAPSCAPRPPSTVPEPPDEFGLVSPDPAPADDVAPRRCSPASAGRRCCCSASRRADRRPALRSALLSPRGQSYGDGPNDFQVNRTFAVTRDRPRRRPRRRTG